MTALGLRSRNAAIRWEQELLVHQGVAIGFVAVSAIAVWVIHLIAPNFFIYPYLTWGGWEAVLRFWPMFAWGIVLNLFVRYLIGHKFSLISAEDSRELLGYEVVTSTLAGLWEELGYRWAFICFAMIGIAFWNWIFEAGLGWVLVIGAFVMTIVLSLSREYGASAVTLVIAVLSLFFALYANPIYWIYEVLTWVVHITTFTLADSVIYGVHDRLLIFGAIVANAWFRDGHKYQGPLGLVNSWYAGIVLLYATVTYGLLTAIAVHAVNNIIVSVQRYLMQRTR